MTNYTVALTGGIGKGKSTVANAFAALDVPLVDSDVIARQIVQPDSPVLRDIAQYFGLAVLCADGSLDRAALRERIFSNPEEKAWLNNLLHPLIQRQTEQQLHSATAPYVLWVVPLLIENNLQQHSNRVLIVEVDREIQIARTLSRDGGSRAQVENILAAQATRQQRMAFVDDIIYNNGHSEEIKDRVATLHQQYLALATLATRHNNLL